VITVLVNNFNYGDYLCEAVESVLHQSLPVNEIIVVDDGSTDDSLARLKTFFRNSERIRVIAKENGGQLSAFNAGFEASQGDIIFFLDADDKYDVNYVRRVVGVFERRPDVHVVASSYRMFGMINEERHNDYPEGCAGFSFLRTYYLNSWIGTVTSGLAMRRSLLGRILPYVAEQNWRTRADDCLVIGASLKCAKKYFIYEIGPQYRVHGANHFACRKYDNDRSYAYQRARIKLLSDFGGNKLPPAGQAILLIHEAQSIETLRLRDWMDLLTVWLRIEDTPHLKWRALLSLIKVGVLKLMVGRK